MTPRPTLAGLPHSLPAVSPRLVISLFPQTLALPFNSSIINRPRYSPYQYEKQVSELNASEALHSPDSDPRNSSHGPTAAALSRETLMDLGPN